MIKIFNTLTGKKEEFVPLKDGEVKMYVCGPTVYNLIHIGNARPMIVFDTVKRYLQYKGYAVTYVSNFTDVDDKIIKKSIEEGTSSDEVSTHYIYECEKDMDGMNISSDIIHPLATRVMPDIIAMIEELIKKGYAYEADGHVYYRVRKFSDYGKLSGKNIDDLEAGHRDIKVTGENDKEDPLDFVLWKPKKDGEPYWESPWGDGRPGWHIECSAMAKKYLGDEIDIHAGGEDLIFPHHENEIAQSEAANGSTFARYWMHNAFLNINNKKMSKSLGNFFTVRDISKHFSLDVLRFFMLGAHYRNPINFSDDLMQAAANGLDRIKTAASNLDRMIQAGDIEGMSAEEGEKLKTFDKYKISFEEAMDDDFNTADAIAAVFDFVKDININVNFDSTPAFAAAVKDRLIDLTDVLGLRVEEKIEILDSDIEELIEERRLARANKDFEKADRIRETLESRGIILKDTRDGVVWKRK